LAHVLATGCRVTIGTPNESPLRSPSVEVRSYAGGGMEQLVSSHDIVIAFGYLLREHPAIRKARFLVIDLYDPFLLENLLMHDDLPMSRRAAVHAFDLGVLAEQLRRADFFICASDRQRDFWLGALAIANRVNPQAYAEDPTLRRLVDVVPFGLPSTPPAATAAAIRSADGPIGPHDIVVLWGGGIWNWFDPLTAIEAIAALREEIPALRLYFMGLRHPNPDLPQMEMARRAVALAGERGLLDHSVFFRDGWVPYDERQNYLADADIGISLHFDHVETRYSYRTRLLDYLWAGLPTISTGGDVLSDEIAGAGAGISVAQGNVAEVSDALRQLARDIARRRAMRERARVLAVGHTWQRAAAPLLEYCRAPHASAGGRPAEGARSRWVQLRDAWRRSRVRQTAGRIRRRLERQRRGA
jgi:glycosyltransferase involved in cell wall biosynthesis